MSIEKIHLPHLLIGLIALCHTISSAAQDISERLIESELARTSTNPDSEITLTIDAPRAFAFDFLTRRMNEYVPDASRVEFDHSNSDKADQLSTGSDRNIIMEGGEILVQQFLRFDPPQSYAYFVDMERSTVNAPLAYSISRYELTEIDAETTQLQITVVYRSSTRLLAYFVRRGFENALRRDFANTADMIQAEYQASR